MSHEKHASCIEACVRCAQECEHCADACLGEPDVKRMAECIRLDRDCAQMCWTAAALVSRGSHFAADLCRSLGVPFVRLVAELDPDGPDLEARARAERYRLLLAEARASGHTTVLTGHHSDDALETVLMRWVRGTDVAGLRGPRAELAWHAEPGLAPVRIVRPLLVLRREEVRALLAARGLTWREDSSNGDARFTRSRVRHGFLPLLHELGGAAALEELRDFSRAVEELESEFARATAHLAWRPAPYAAATRTAGERTRGGVLARGELMALARPLARRVLWRLLTEGTGQAPGRLLLERVVTDLCAGRTTRYALSAHWRLLLRARELVLVPPPEPVTQRPDEGAAQQLLLPFPSQPFPSQERSAPRPLHLGVPGIVTLPDGRRLSAELARVPPGTQVTRAPLEVEVDATDLSTLFSGEPALGVRFPVPGDRFRALGAPGTKALTRFLADRGVPREERARIPLVTAGAEILWAAGLAPSERRRVHARTEWRLRLALHA